MSESHSIRVSKYHRRIVKAARRKGFTLAEVLLAFFIFAIITAMILSVVTGGFRSFREGQRITEREQGRRRAFFRLSKEISSMAHTLSIENRFKGNEKEFFFIFVQNDNLTEARYSYDSESGVLEKYYEQPPDYRWDTYKTKEILLTGLDKCVFSYLSDGEWKTNWDKEDQLTEVIKINLKFKDEEEKEFLVNVPVGK